MKSDRTLRQLTVPAILVLICILAGWVLSYRADLRIPGTFVNLPAHVSALLGEFGSAALFLIFLVLFLRHRLHPQQVQFFMAAGFAATVAFMSSLSWPTSVGILVPSFTFVLAAILAGLRECSGSKTLRPLVLAACLVCVIQVGWQKFSSPFEWSGRREPDVHIAHQTVPLPELQGYYLSPQTAAFVTRVTDDIAAHSTPSQPIFVYPDLPIFCVLAHRQLETLGYVHFIDVAPDFVDRADAVTLRNHPPAVIVYLIPSEEDLREGELLFRGGRPSGQRDLVSALAAIRPEYERIDRLVAPGTGKPIDVLALKNSPR